jgi:hypothetical protein
MPAAKKPAEVKKTRKTLDLAAVDVGESTDAPGAFARGGIPDDHPLAILFTESYGEGVAKRVATSTPDEVIKVLRKLATARDLGLSVRKDDSSVVFQVGEKQVRSRRPREEALNPVDDFEVRDDG